MKWTTYHTEGIKRKYIYRYLTLEKLVDFLDTGELFLTRLDKFEDNLESIEPYDINELKIQSGLTEKPQNANPNIPEHQWDELIKNSRAGLIQIQKKLQIKQKHRFVSCWILNDVESFAMWDIYGKSGFAIRFERSYFQKLIEDCMEIQKGKTKEIDLLVAGKVVYQNFDDMFFQEEESLLRFSAFRKHLSFNHENEYRIVGFMKEILNVPGLRYKLPDIENLEFDIIANPRLDGFQFDKYQGILGKYSQKHRLTESELKIWLEFRNNNY
ncbi:MAG: DUF2971 domain-containing protein [Bacteroidota bacterium]